MKKKVALITGITGQDGSLLARFLLNKNYEVHGIKRRSSSFNTQRIDEIYKDTHEKNVKLFLHYGDLTDSVSLLNIVKKVRPIEIYNLAAQSHVKVSFETPEYTANADAIGTLRLLEAIRLCKLEKQTKFYQASTSEMYGSSPPPQDENTPMHPASPYGVAKLYAHWVTKNYREAYNIFASTGILFNHEGPSRGETFVSRKITMGIANLLSKKVSFLYLGNLDAKRDWGDARDYVKAMWKILQQKKSDDFVIATNKSYSVRQFAEIAFSTLNIHIKWRGKGLNEVGYDSKSKKVLIKIDKKYFRPLEVDHLRGKYNKAKKVLKWEPKISFKTMIKDMLSKDLRSVGINLNDIIK